MEIIKKGKTENKRIKFTCPICDCVFIAEQGEYEEDLAYAVVYRRNLYCCECPTCKHTVMKEV